MFDMDGTLTESRLAFDETILSDSIYQLTNHGIHFGIITGSDEDYLREQMGGFYLKHLLALKPIYCHAMELNILNHQNFQTKILN